MAKHRYLMVIEPPADPRRECYGGWFPDLPGCFTAGDSIPHLKTMAKEAISLHLWALEEAGQPIPTPKYRAAFIDIDTDLAVRIVNRPIGKAKTAHQPARRAAAARNGSIRQLTVGRAGKRGMR